MPNTELCTIYHGTTHSVAQQIIENRCDLYGYVYPGEPSISGNLTNSLEAAQEYAHDAAEDYLEKPAILIFHIPAEELVLEGSGFRPDWLRYSTNQFVALSEVPEAFIQKLGVNRDNPLESKFNYYRVPSKYAEKSIFP